MWPLESLVKYDSAVNRGRYLFGNQNTKHETSIKKNCRREGGREGHVQQVMSPNIFFAQEPTLPLY